MVYWSHQSFQRSRELKCYKRARIVTKEASKAKRGLFTVNRDAILPLKSFNGRFTVHQKYFNFIGNTNYAFRAYELRVLGEHERIIYITWTFYRNNDALCTAFRIMFVTQAIHQRIILITKFSIAQISWSLLFSTILKVAFHNKNFIKVYKFQLFLISFNFRY